MTNLETSGWLYRLRERGVIRVAASYAVIAWLLLQIADVTFEPLGVPRWVMVSLIVAAVLAFPVAVALAWFYEAGDSGVALDTAAEGVIRPVTHGLRRYADILIIGVLLAAVAVLLVRHSDLGGASAAKPAIAVLPFQNLSTAPDGEVLASGIAESVLHQLASLAQLDVISRPSSFALGHRGEDAREIGRQLGARYLLEGSVQSDHSRMRVTTQLIDTQTGADVWSMRFDRRPGDIFDVQDEIAVQVTQALRISLDAQATDRLTGQGTQTLPAYLAFLQGRALLANGRLIDMREAIGQFERAINADPKFAAAYVSLAEAELYVAEFEVADDRPQRFERATRRARELAGQALSLDPDLGDAYLVQAYLEAFDDLETAERDYRRGLELSPNSAKGYDGLATILFETPSRRNEALAMLDRARKLDPLEPGYDVRKAVFLIDERGDTEAADRLLVNVVNRSPRYAPALSRLATLRIVNMGQAASGIRYAEEALALDPLLEDTRRVLSREYVNLGDERAARQLVGEIFDEMSPRALPILLHQRRWVDAGEVAYASLARGTDTPFSHLQHLLAIRMHARTTGDFARAQAALQEASGTRWATAGDSVVLSPGVLEISAAIALADVLLASGQEQKGRMLLATIINRWRHEVSENKRPELWYFLAHPVALALYGDREAAIGMLERSISGKFQRTGGLGVLEIDPAYAAMREDPRFQALVRNLRQYYLNQRRELARMRVEGLVPDRRVYNVDPLLSRNLKHQLHQPVSRGARCPECRTMQDRAGLTPAKLPHQILANKVLKLALQ